MPTRNLPPAALAALRRLMEGNARFVAHLGDEERKRWDPIHAAGQRPIAVVLGCSDSRAPAELVFDQGLGDLFVIRVAGNVVAPSQIGSIEFAVATFGTPLVVVMGHTRCGAIQATVDELEREAGHGPALDAAAPQLQHVRSITSRIRPFIEPLWRRVPPDAEGAVRAQALREVMRANALAAAAALRHGSAFLEEEAAQGRLGVIGAAYELESGRVELL